MIEQVLVSDGSPKRGIQRPRIYTPIKITFYVPEHICHAGFRE